MTGYRMCPGRLTLTTPTEAIDVARHEAVSDVMGRQADKGLIELAQRSKLPHVAHAARES